MIDSLEIICVNNQVDSDIDDEPYFFSAEEKAELQPSVAG